MVCMIPYVPFGSISPVSLAVVVLVQCQYLPCHPTYDIPLDSVCEQMHQCLRLSPPSWMVAEWGRSLGPCDVNRCPYWLMF